jgi:hypothetical protein
MVDFFFFQKKWYYLPKLNQDWVNDLNHPIVPNTVEAIIKSYQQQQQQQQQQQKPRNRRF